MTHTSELPVIQLYPTYMYTTSKSQCTQKYLAGYAYTTSGYNNLKKSPVHKLYRNEKKVLSMTKKNLSAAVQRHVHVHTHKRIKYMYFVGSENELRPYLEGHHS